MHPLKRHGFAAGLAGALVAWAASADAASARAVRIDIRPGPLGDALAELARENRVELLFDEALVRGRTAKALKATLTIEQALSILLSGTGVRYRATPEGAFVLQRSPRSAIADEGDGAIAELLVIGRRTQNVDIRRTENDIQPYSIIGPRELRLAPQDSIEQLLRDRLPANGQTVSPSQLVAAGASSNSAIDLRGVGTQRTLVLVDGRRLPGLPTMSAGLSQSDLNAIPLGLVERIETLTATAGGIHGPTAIGGVVNVVLDRQYRGADLTLASGLSSRGDAGRMRLEARAGFTPDGGRTDVMLAASYAAARPLTVGQRDYVRRSLQRQAANNPAHYPYLTQPVNAVVVYSRDGAPLRLDPEFGGATLGSDYTFLPLDFRGDEQALVAALAANSGLVVTDPAPGLAGEETSLVVTPKSYAALVSVRHRISERLEAFADGLYLANRGRARLPASVRTSANADAPGNPFAQAVTLNFPVASMVDERWAKNDVRRITGGLIASLPWRWQASAEYTSGRAILETGAQRLVPDADFSLRVNEGRVGPNGEPALVPLGDQAALQAAVRAYLTKTFVRERLTNDFSAASVRAAGPLGALPGGPLTLTLLGELQREHMPATRQENLAGGQPVVLTTFKRTQEVRSGYVELRAPLAPQDFWLVPARGLEVQLALRHDEVRTTFPENALPGTTGSPDLTIRHGASVFTVGGRVRPTPWLMLRASLATGEAPPDLRHLQERIIPVFDTRLVDPRRGGRALLAEGPVVQVRNGSRKAGQEKGRTISAGVVINPSGEGVPRISADVSRVEIRGELVSVQRLLQEVIDAEALYPEWVDREPLSAADAAQGLTAGRITALYTGFGNAGRTVAETLDVQLDWMLPPTSRGQARIYGAATWQPTLRTKLRRETPWIDRTGFRDSPLEWRGVAGVEWTSGPLSVDLNLQYFGGFSILWSPVSVVRIQSNAFQGSMRVPSQTYVDLVVRRRFKLPAGGPLQAVEARLAVQNLLDRSPPIVADPNHLGYDYRGDPRRRRFELLLTARF